MTEVSSSYVQYFIDLDYCFQFTASYLVVYRIILIYNVSCRILDIYNKDYFLSINYVFEVTFMFFIVFIDSLYVPLSYVDERRNMDSFIFINKVPDKKILTHKFMAVLCLGL